MQEKYDNIILKTSAESMLLFLPSNSGRMLTRYYITIDPVVLRMTSFEARESPYATPTLKTHHLQ